MGKDVKSDRLSDDDFFAFQREQDGAARRAMQDYARNKPAMLREELKEAVRKGVEAQAARDDAAIKRYNDRVLYLRGAIKRADAEAAGNKR